VPGLDIDLHLDELRHIPVRHIRRRVACLGIVRCRCRRFIPVLHDRRALFIVPFLKRDFSGFLDRVTGHERHARGRCAAGVVRFAGIMADKLDLFDRHAHRLGGHLHEHGMRALSHVCPSLAHDHALDLRLAVNLDSDPVPLIRAERKTDVLEAHRHANSAPFGRVCRLLNRHSLPSLGGLLPVVALPRPVGQHPVECNARRQRRPHRHNAPLAQHVPRANFDRVHAQGFGQLVHLAFRRKCALRPAKAAERPTRNVVGVDPVRIHLDVRDLVGAGDHQVRVAQHFGRGVGVSAGIAVHLSFGSDHLAVARGPPLRPDHRRMALVMAQDRFLAAPDDLHRAPQFHRRQPQHNLDRHILTPAERAANGRIDDPHLLLGQTQRVRDLLAVFVHPLPGHQDGHPAAVVDIAQAGLRLEIGVLLEPGAVFALDNHVRLIPGRVHIAMPDAVMDQHVVPGMGMQLGRAVGHSVEHIEHPRQVFVFDLDELHGSGGRFFRVCHHQRHLIRQAAHDIRAFLGTPRPAQHGLIGYAQPVLIDGHILGRENRHHAGIGFGTAGIDLRDPRVDAVRKPDFHPQLAVHVDIARIRRLTGHLPDRIHAARALADSVILFAHASPYSLRQTLRLSPSTNAIFYAAVRVSSPL